MGKPHKLETSWNEWMATVEGRRCANAVRNSNQIDMLEWALRQAFKAGAQATPGKCLSWRQREVLRYLDEGYTLLETAHILGVTRERIRQIRDRARRALAKRHVPSGASSGAGPDAPSSDT